MKSTLVLALVAALAVGACGKKDEAASAAKPGQVKLQNAGRIVQVQQAGTYTYLEVMVDSGEKVWMAGAHIEAKPGDPVQWGNASMMANYPSKTLGRTFERILFVESWSNGNGGPSSVAAHGSMPPGGHPPMAGGVPGGHPPMPGAGPAPAGGGNGGVAKSVTNAGGYSYIEVDQGGPVVWIAVPEAPVKMGDKVAWDGGAVMQNFQAKSLNRTFERIVFAGGVNVVK